MDKLCIASNKGFLDGHPQKNINEEYGLSSKFPGACLLTPKVSRICAEVQIKATPKISRTYESEKRTPPPQIKAFFKKYTNFTFRSDPNKRAPAWGPKIRLKIVRRCVVSREGGLTRGGGIGTNQGWLTHRNLMNSHCVSVDGELFLALGKVPWLLWEPPKAQNFKSCLYSFEPCFPVLPGPPPPP